MLATKLVVGLRSDLSIEVKLWNNSGLTADFTFLFVSPGTTSDIYSRVFATLARMVRKKDSPNWSKLEVRLPEAYERRNCMRTRELTPFLQSIADSSTIEPLKLYGAFPFLDDDMFGLAVAQQTDNTPESTDMFRLVTAVADNLTSPHSVLENVTLYDIDFDDDLLTLLCESLSSNHCRVVKFILYSCQFPTLGPLWSALGANQSIQTVDVGLAETLDPVRDDMYGAQQLQSMLETNTVMTKIKMKTVQHRLLNAFFTALGAGLTSKTTLKVLDIGDIPRMWHGHLGPLFEGGLNCNTGVEKLRLPLCNSSATQDLVLGLDQMAKNISTRRVANGSHRVAALKSLALSFVRNNDDLGCIKMILDCLVRISACFAWEEVNFTRSGYGMGKNDAEVLAQLAMFIQSCPSLKTCALQGGNSGDDVLLVPLVDIVNKHTTLTKFQACGIDATSDYARCNRWSPLDNPNRTRILCSIVRNIRKLPMLLEPSKRNVLPLVLGGLLKSRQSGTEQVVNLNHAFYLIQSLPELFSTGSLGSVAVEVKLGPIEE